MYADKVVPYVLGAGCKEAVSFISKEGPCLLDHRLSAKVFEGRRQSHFLQLSLGVL